MKWIKQILELLGKLWHWVCTMWHRCRRFTMRDGSSISHEQPPYPNCWNCGAELVGAYCHKCGQYATPTHPKMISFLSNYIENVFMLESKTLPTLLNLIFHPGRLAKEYFAGRFASYINPLQFNIFILISMIALFALLGTDSKVENSFEELTKREEFRSEFALAAIDNSEGYSAKAIASTERDTIRLVAMYSSVEKYPQYVEVLETIKVTDSREESDTLIAVVPTMFIEDGVITNDGDSDSYSFSLENEVVNESLMLNKMLEMWGTLISTLFGHFPLLMLFTTPFMAWALRMIVRRKQHPRSFYYIFTLYYMAFVEFLFLMLYLATHAFGLGYDAAKIILQTILFFYLTIALKHTYEIKSWIGSAVAGVIINCVYMLACLLVLSAISFVILVISVAA